MSVPKIKERMNPVLAGIFMAVLLAACGGNIDKGNEIKSRLPETVAGWQLQKDSQVYDRQTIFDYIDGAGEVYLAYEFSGVSVFHYEKDKAPQISVEIFDMGTPGDAYGVFSHARESEETGIGNGYEYRGSLLGFWQDKYYVSVLADEQTPESKEAVFAIAEYIADKLPQGGQKPEILGCLPQEGLDRSTVRYFHLHSMLNYHYFLSEENLLNMSPETNAALGVYQPDRVYLVFISYPNQDAAADGYRRFVHNYLPEGLESGMAELENGQWAVARHLNNFVMLALDVPDMDRAEALFETCRENIMKHLQEESTNEGQS